MAIRTESFNHTWGTAQEVNERIKFLEEQNIKIIKVSFTSPQHAYIVYEV